MRGPDAAHDDACFSPRTILRIEVLKNRGRPISISAASFAPRHTACFMPCWRGPIHHVAEPRSSRETARTPRKHRPAIGVPAQYRLPSSWRTPPVGDKTPDDVAQASFSAAGRAENGEGDEGCHPRLSGYLRQHGQMGLAGWRSENLRGPRRSRSSRSPCARSSADFRMNIRPAMAIPSFPLSSDRVRQVTDAADCPSAYKNEH